MVVVVDGTVVVLLNGKRERTCDDRAEVASGASVDTSGLRDGVRLKNGNILLS